MKKLFLLALLVPCVAVSMEKKKEISFSTSLTEIHTKHIGGAAYHPVTQSAWIGIGKKQSYDRPSLWKVAALTGISWGVLNNNFLTNWWYGQPVKPSKKK